MEEPKPEFSHHFTPEQLRTNRTFQESFVVTKPFLQNMLQHLQRQKAVEYKDSPEKAGTHILIINDVMDLLDKMTASDLRLLQTRPKRPKLHNKP